ncbi:MAG: hypothetical protein H6562_21340 [Lewinellaceae bacterium]|nr:hypothetical protein [Lewinellaceae bacterium]
MKKRNWSQPLTTYRVKNGKAEVVNGIFKVINSIELDKAASVQITKDNIFGYGNLLISRYSQKQEWENILGVFGAREAIQKIIDNDGVESNLNSESQVFKGKAFEEKKDIELSNKVLLIRPLSDLWEHPHYFTTGKSAGSYSDFIKVDDYVSMGQDIFRYWSYGGDKPSAKDRFFHGANDNLVYNVISPVSGKIIAINLFVRTFAEDYDYKGLSYMKRDWLSRYTGGNFEPYDLEFRTSPIAIQIAKEHENQVDLDPYKELFKTIKKYKKEAFVNLAKERGKFPFFGDKTEQEHLDLIDSKIEEFYSSKVFKVQTVEEIENYINDKIEGYWKRINEKG